MLSQDNYKNGIIYMHFCKDEVHLAYKKTGYWDSIYIRVQMYTTNWASFTQRDALLLYKI